MRGGIIWTPVWREQMFGWEAARGLLLGLFDPPAYTHRQFMWMAIGGGVDHLMPELLFIALFRNLESMQGLAAAGLAFIVQALSVYIPVLSQIRHGADAQPPWTWEHPAA